MRDVLVLFRALGFAAAVLPAAGCHASALPAGPSASSAAERMTQRSRASGPRVATPGADMALPITLTGVFWLEYGIAADASGNVYVADSGNDVVRKVAPPFTGLTNGTITPVGAQYAGPDGVAVSASCTSNCAVYVADTYHSAIEQVVPPGALWFTATDGKLYRMTNAGVLTQPFSGPAAVAPGGLADGPNGTIWYAGVTSLVRLQ